jgi:hypothetical protein
MYQITELPAWDSKGEPKLLSTKCTSVRLFEEKERLRITSNYPTGNNISLYLSKGVFNEFFDKLPMKFRSSSIEGLVPTKRKLLIAFLTADKRYGCCIMRRGGYTYVLKPDHPQHVRCVLTNISGADGCYIQ